MFINRLKSFAWRFGIFMLPVAVTWFVENLPTLGLPVVVTGLVAYILNEFTKYWNTKMKVAGRGFFGGLKRVKE